VLPLKDGWPSFSIQEKEAKEAKVCKKGTLAIKSHIEEVNSIGGLEAKN
jgi:hypothetical protein